VNVNLRAFYAEGSKSMGFEIAEDLGWRFPQHVVCPMAGGALIGKIHKAFTELNAVGLVDQPVTTKMWGAQAAGCNPITDCVKSGRERHKPVRKPSTICKSLAIGDPADGYFAAKLIRDSGGWAEDVTDEEIVLCVTGNGLKTQDAVFDAVESPAVIKPSLAEFEALSGLKAGEPALV